MILSVIDDQGAINNKTVNITILDTTDLSINSSHIFFSNTSAFINQTISIYATILNLKDSDSTATVNFYDGNPLFNTSRYLGYANVSISQDGNETVTIESNFSTIGTHNIYVVLSNIKPIDINEENNIAFNSIKIKKPKKETPGNLMLDIFLAIAILTIILFYIKKKNTAKM